MFSVFKFFKKAAGTNAPTSKQIPEECASETAQSSEEEGWAVIELTEEQRAALFPPTVTMISTLFENGEPKAQDFAAPAPAPKAEPDSDFAIV